MIDGHQVISIRVIDAHLLSCCRFNSPENGELAMNEKFRRRKIMALAMSVPAVWMKPVVEDVVLPAHAGTSPCATFLTCDGSEYPCESTDCVDEQAEIERLVTAECIDSEGGGAGNTGIVYDCNLVD